MIDHKIFSNYDKYPFVQQLWEYPVSTHYSLPVHSAGLPNQQPLVNIPTCCGYALETRHNE